MFLVLAISLSHGIKASAVKSSLPSCLSPTGSSCDWYPNCLEKKYPCESSSYPYAISYAYKFCKLYDAKKYLFSAEEWDWVSSVRKCLQVTLAPVLNQTSAPSCQDIRSKGFKSHAPCYLSPSPGAPSICNLGCDVYLKVFRVIKGSLTSWDSFWEMMKASWYIVKQCGFTCSLTSL